MKRGRACSSWWLVPVALALSSAGSAQVIRVGAEFQVNTYITGYQKSPSVAVGPGGDFVVVWAERSRGLVPR